MHRHTHIRMHSYICKHLQYLHSVVFFLPKIVGSTKSIEYIHVQIYVLQSTKFKQKRKRKKNLKKKEERWDGGVGERRRNFKW